MTIELPKEDFKAGADLPGERRERGGIVEVMTADVDGALAALRAGGSRLAHLRVRPRTLEDLFLALTGRELRE